MNEMELTVNEMELPLVSVVIPTRNRATDLEECIQSILRQTYRNLELIIIDDNSSDNTSEVCCKYNVRYIVNRERRAESYCTNLGINSSKGYLVVTTDDDCIADPAWIEKLVNVIIKRKDVGIVGGRIIPLRKYIFADGSVATAFRRARKNSLLRFLARLIYLKTMTACMHACTGKIHYNGDISSNFDSLYEGEVEWVSGGSMCIDKRKVKILFDERLRYFAEPDFCLRARQKGTKVYFTPYAKVWHKFSASSRDTFNNLYTAKKNQILFVLKNRIAMSNIFSFFHFVFSQTIDTILYLTLSITDVRYSVALRGKLDGLKASINNV